MDFDIVIATRNRQKALPLSVSLMLSQHRLPGRLIIVDASDDPGSVKQSLEGCIERSRARVDLDFLHSAPGTSHQRNLGLKRVSAPVVLLPDDDALWYPGLADAVMRIYERDTDGLIGGVGAIEEGRPPPGVFDGGRPEYRMSVRDRLKGSIGRLVDALEAACFPDPLYLEGSDRARLRPVPGWLPEEDALPGNNLEGFRMSFRTQLILERGFDEALGRYALFEDHDACLHVLEHHALVNATDARVCHYRSPEQRVGGLEWGVMHVLNRAYIVLKHSPPGSRARRYLRRFCRFKLARLAVQAGTSYGVERVRGAARGMRLLGALEGADGSPERLRDAFVAARARCLEAGHRRRRLETEAVPASPSVP